MKRRIFPGLLLLALSVCGCSQPFRISYPRPRLLKIADAITSEDRPKTGLRHSLSLAPEESP